MHNKEAKKTQCHLMRFEDLIFLHLSWQQVKWRDGVWAENENKNRAFSRTQSSFKKRDFVPPSSILHTAHGTCPYRR
jgi:hypothetical protein